MTFPGSRWYKCDLHLHTPASECFPDKATTADQFVLRAKERGLDCIAVTDHNTPVWIDSIKASAVTRGLTVFPGVEITCDTSKVHLLVLFDTTKSSDDVRDFLVTCGISRDSFGKRDAHTPKSIFEIISIATQQNAIVIPAHIDDYNGLGSFSRAIIETLFNSEHINGVQITRKEFWSSPLTIKTSQEIKTAIAASPLPVSDDTADSWTHALQTASKKGLAFLAFSDNPQSPGASKHGLEGIGDNYTWIKMDAAPTLEGIRQALLLPHFRVRACLFCPDHPYRFPDLWLKSLSITETSITDPVAPLTVEFSPQLTTIIGGRGSGKSSILRFIRGLFSKTADVSTLADILKDHDDFYKRPDGKNKAGVLREQSTVIVTLFRHATEYRITVSDIFNSSHQKRTIEMFDANNNCWTAVTQAEFIQLFEFEQYSQKQIYEIAQEPNSLRERIDKAVDGLDALQKDKAVIRRSYLEKSAAIRTIQQQLSGKAKLETEIKDLDERIKLYQQSGIANLLTARNNFVHQEELLRKFYDEIQTKETTLSSVIPSFQLSPLDLSSFLPAHAQELTSAAQRAADSLAVVMTEIDRLRILTSQIKDTFSDSVKKSQWLSAFDANKVEFQQKKIELSQQGIDDIANFELLTTKRTEKFNEMQTLLALDTRYTTEVADVQRLVVTYTDKCKAITKLRRDFVSSLLQGEKINIKINPFRNKADFILKLRAIMQRETGFDKDVETLTAMCFAGNVEQKIQEVRAIFGKIRRSEHVDSVSGHFVNLVQKLSEAQIDEIELMLPEDDIEVQYKPTGSNAWKPLSTASAGQKTTAVLTFILSYGKSPLILDQPEDDLDNRLVYELIVDRLAKTKERRQVVVVTHNANIPVNGDAEYIISMDSDSKVVKVLHTGTVDQAAIKKEICDVMEGSEYAFQMRAKRYRDIT